MKGSNIPRVTAPALPANGRRKPLRSDIQTLRAMAVTLVVAFHLWPAAVRGGYIGVDIFFVISGYLLTHQLAAELETTGRVCATAFWARRAKRLLPSSLVVLASTAIATYLCVPPPFWEQFLGEIIASTLYVQNWVLAYNSVDYFAADNAPSPVQHFWTLSVEEQFYGALPLLMSAVGFATKRRAMKFRRRALTATLGMLTFSSFLFSGSFNIESGLRYFSTFARAWEFGAGAVLSLAPVNATSSVRQFGLGGGCAAIVVAVLMGGAGESGHVVGVEIYAVLGTLMILARGSVVDQSGASAFFGLRPVQRIGALSYGIYLWHWPLVTMLPIALARGLTCLDKGAIAVSSIGLAWVTERWIEAPIRFSEGPLVPRDIWVRGAIGSCAVLMLATGGLIVLDNLGAKSDALGRRMVADFPGCFGAGTKARGQPCARRPPGDMLVPEPAVAARDEGNRKECWASTGQTAVNRCSLGPKVNYRKRIAVIGDSHSNALLPAYAAIAEAEGWRIDVAGKIGCYWTAAVQVQRTVAQVEECEAWKTSLNAMLEREVRYDAIVVTHGVSRAQPAAEAGKTQAEVIVQGLLTAWKSQARRGVRIIAIRDNPIATRDTPHCVARHRARANEYCSLNRALAFAAFDGNVHAAALLPGSRLIDLTEYYCDNEACLTVIGNVVVYRDADHITATFARTLAPQLGHELRMALEN